MARKILFFKELITIDVMIISHRPNTHETRAQPTFADLSIDAPLINIVKHRS